MQKLRGASLIVSTATKGTSHDTINEGTGYIGKAVGLLHLVDMTLVLAWAALRSKTSPFVAVAQPLYVAREIRGRRLADSRKAD